ncbi:MAG TPA: hypothetical protein VIA62_28580 [Thermoanaerobaculia bacterium]|nr:hypothetical protein [Thermoanaerobaculia bacterium]
MLRKPVLNQGIKDALTAAGNTDRIGEIESGIDDFGDAAFVLSFNAQSDTIGRRFSDQRALFDALVEGIMPTEAMNAARRKAQDRRNAILQQLAKKLTLKPGQVAESLPISEFTGRDRADLELAIRDDAEVEAGREALISKGLKDSHLATFAELVDNQPQLIATFTQRHRNKQVGPDEFSFQGSFEWSLFSLNGLRRTAGGKPNLDAFKKYVERPSAQYGDRFKLSVEYSRTQAYSLSMPDDSVDIHLPTARRLSVSLTYGRRLLLNTAGEELARIDLQGRYDDYTDDPTHRDRGVIDLTYTHKVSDSFSFPLGLSYANHSQFLDPKDRRVLSVHFGLHAKLFGDK